MLDRYRKPGGFVQLLNVLETCGPTKQTKFLELIRAEDSRWADAIQKKMLDIKRIYSWKDETIQEVVGTLQDLTLAICLVAADEELRGRITGLLPSGRKRKIQDLMDAQKPSAAEVATMHVKVIETVRKMSQTGELRFDKVDPELAIEDGIEDLLNKAPIDSSNVVSLHGSTHSSQFSIEYDSSDGSANTNGAAPEPSPLSQQGMSDVQVQELSNLRRKVTDLGRENAILRKELSVAKQKLEQIKKIA